MVKVKKCVECGGAVQKSNGEFVCEQCGLVATNIRGVAYEPLEDRQKPPNAEIEDDGVGFNPNWKDTDPIKVAKNPLIKYSEFPALHYCPKYNEAFYARTMIRTDPETGAREFYCQVCAKKRQGKKSWHYIKKLKFNYDNTAILTAVLANSGTSLTHIYKFCKENFIGKWDYKRVRKIMLELEARKLINIRIEYTKQGKMLLASLV